MLSAYRLRVAEMSCGLGGLPADGQEDAKCLRRRCVLAAPISSMSSSSEALRMRATVRKCPSSVSTVRGPIPGDAFEFASEKVVAAFLAVEGDAEAVRLVADMAHHFERFARAAEVVGHRIARVVDLFEPFGQSHDRNLFFESQFAQDGIGVRELALAAVDDHQVGQLLSLGHEARVAAEDDLAHRGEVVGSDDGLDVEMAVLLARGAAVAEDHARGDGGSFLAGSSCRNTRCGAAAAAAAAPSAWRSSAVRYGVRDS